MDALSWINSLPTDANTTRNQMVLDAVASGLATVNWVPVTSTIKDHTAIFQVCEDAVRVEDNGNRFRFQVTAKMNQQCADLLNASMVTTKIMDLSYQQASTVVDATVLSAGAQMSSTAYSKTWNQKVDIKRNGEMGLFRDCGKAWVLDNALANSAGAINYGFFAKNALYTNARNIKLWQNTGTRHNAQHQDYSQTLFLMSNMCQVDGQDMNVIDVMKDPILSYLINYGGVLKYIKQPM